MIVVIRKDDYGTPVVFVECWGGPWWWCWWVDVSEKPTKRRGRTKKLRREMLNERKRKIQNWQKRIWKVESSSPQQRASRARSPGSGDGQQETPVQLVPGGGWCDTTITWSYITILFRSSLPVPGMASINQQPQLATNGRAKMSRRSVAGWLRQESVQIWAQHCGQVPGVPVRDLLLGAKQEHGGPPRRGAVVDETDTETAGQTLVKKQRSAATPKLKVARAQVFQSVTKNKKGNNANRWCW